MKKKLLIFSLMLGLLSFILWSCGGNGGHYTAPTKNVGGAAVKDFMIGSKVSIFDATGKQVDDGNCKTGDYGIFNCAIPASAKAPYTVVISGGKFDKDGKSATDNDTGNADNVTLATLIPNDNTPTVANPLTTAMLLDTAGTDNVSALKDKAKDFADNATVIESKMQSLGGLVFVDNVTADTIQSVETKVTKIVQAFDNKSFDNTTGVYTGNVENIVKKLKEDLSDGSLDGKKDNETLTDVDNNTVELPEDVTTVLPRVVATSVTIGGKTDDNLTDGIEITDADSLNKQFKVKVSAENADGTYYVTAKFYAKDINGKREITATLTGVTVTISDNGTNISAKVAKDATVAIKGKDSSGNNVETTLTNLVEDTLTFSNGELTYDLSKVESKLAGSDASQLQEIFVAGTSYKVELSIDGLPNFKNISGTVTVGTPECGAGSFLKYCTTEGDCTDQGGYWYDNKCNSEAQCTTDNLTACNTQAKCEGIGKYWYNDQCNAEEQAQPAATATITKTADVTGTAGGVIGFKASVTLPEGVTCDNCTYIWDLDSNGYADSKPGGLNTNTVTAFYGQEATQGTATVYVVNSSNQCVAKGTYSYDLAGDALGATPPQALDLVSINENSTTAVPNCQ